MIEKEVVFDVGDETLRGTLTFSDVENKPSVIFLHGAGPYNRHLFNYLAEFLAKNGVSSFRFDFSGWGESSGIKEKASLAIRLKEAKTAIKEYVDTSQPIKIIATSMGGHIASLLLDFYSVDSLIMFCPAAYSKQAFNLPFNESFSQVLRQKDSFVKSDAFEKIEEFNGKFLMLVGSEDKIIPPQIISEYEKAAKINSKRYELVIFDNAPHNLHKWALKNAEHKTLIENKALSFL